MDQTMQFELLGRVLAAMLLAGVVGLEREFADKPAGIRTHMLTGGAAALLVLLGAYIVDYFGPDGLISSDPIRIVQAIVVGISFLVTGTIFKSSSEDDYVEGLTTGASLLSVAAIGIAVAMELWWLATGVALLNLVINWGLDQLADVLERRAK
jgi:putative Mg2+ transporter-C (MgtC) family protein